ncbi:hypothetical protein DFH29DRAFT_878888 [Suillus ampliporus]|nr:hypothetical protein DFH29DRAFT_878888 [Suillus ampliporus]
MLLMTPGTSSQQATKTIAMSHHKSVCHVQNDLYIGHGNQGQGALKLLIHEIGMNTFNFPRMRKTIFLQSVAFATEGVQHFMGSVMGINNQDLVSKMEGFAVQGMKGATTNHKQQVSEIRLKICNIINTKLCNIFDSCALIELITGDPNARMQWTHYY